MCEVEIGSQEYDQYFLPLKELMGVYPPEEQKKAEAAFLFAARCHADQKRASGEPYIVHPVSVARILLEDYGMDCDSVCAAFLHDVIEDCGVTRRQIAEQFGEDVANLVDGVTKLSKIQYTTKDEEQSEDIRKMLLAMSQDIRVMLIKLADRLHNMRTLGFKKPEKQRMTAVETMEIYAPIAHRLGMHNLKNELEDIAIRCLDPEACREIRERIAMTSAEQTDFLENIKHQIEEKFVGTDIRFRVDVRVKSLCGIYRKVYMQNRDIYDIFAVRIIVDTINECYMALGIIHDTFKPIPDRFKDYISLPKYNGYRSIHTTVISHIGVPFEVQIRTYEMHREAEYGVAAHWKYKIGLQSGDNKSMHFEEKIAWLRQMLEAKASASGEEDLLSSIKEELTNEDVFVFTPKGEVIVLPAGATIIDFAYAIHSAVGNRMTGAKVNGRITPIDTELTSGTVVEILTTQSGEHGPSRDWLKAARTSEARNKIRQWFKKEKRTENIAAGREDFDREIHRIAPRLTAEQYQTVLTDTYRRGHFTNSDDFFAAIGYGGLLISKLLPKLREDCQRCLGDTEEPERPVQPSSSTLRQRNHSGGVIIDGFDNCLVKFAKCCNPVPGDEIIGFITRGGGVAVHRIHCSNVLANREKEPERWLNASWTQRNGELYKAALSVVTNAGANLFTQISQLLSAENVFIEGIQMVPRNDKNGEYLVTVRVQSSTQLRAIITKLTSMSEVAYVKRL